MLIIASRRGKLRVLITRELEDDRKVNRDDTRQIFRDVDARCPLINQKGVTLCRLGQKHDLDSSSRLRSEISARGKAHT